MFIKSIIIVILAVLIRGTLPRYRIDQLILLNWKTFIFINVYFFTQIMTLNLLFKLT